MMTLTGDPSPPVLAQRYRVDERIGVGSMGAVWRATDLLLNRVVAVKQLLVHPGAPGFEVKGYEEAKQRILREGRLAARLQHPHTIAVFDVVLHEDAPWLVMEYLESRTFGALLDAEGPIEPRWAALIGSQIADGLAAAHAAGIVHRDIKPGNVLIGTDGQVKITDFGVSRAADDVQLTRTGMIAGTPAFLAPEIARGRTPTSAADVYALGSTLYAAVEGLPPFGLDDNAYALLYAVGEGKIAPPTKAGPLTEPLMRMLCKEPDGRPSALQVRDELEAVAEGRAVPAPAAPSPAPVLLTAPLVDPAPRQGGAPRPGGAYAPTKVDLSPVVPGPVRPPGQASVQTPTRPAIGPGVVPDAAGSAVAGPGRTPIAPGSAPSGSAASGGSAGSGGSEARGRRGPSRPVLIAVLVAGLLVVATLVLLNTGGAGNPARPSAGPSATASAAPSREPVSGQPTAAVLEGFVRDYYALLPADPSAAWQLLGPVARDQSRGYQGYLGFYQSLSSVSIVEGPTAVGPSTVTATLRFERRGGQSSQERYSFTVGKDPDGKLIMNSFTH
jgi:serine/threonine protein kinase